MQLSWLKKIVLDIKKIFSVAMDLVDGKMVLSFFNFSCIFIISFWFLDVAGNIYLWDKPFFFFEKPMCYKMFWESTKEPEISSTKEPEPTACTKLFCLQHTKKNTLRHKLYIYVNNFILFFFINEQALVILPFLLN